MFRTKLLFVCLLPAVPCVFCVLLTFAT